jgi:hypothetical protein
MMGHAEKVTRQLQNGPTPTIEVRGVQRDPSQASSATRAKSFASSGFDMTRGGSCSLSSSTTIDASPFRASRFSRLACAMRRHADPGVEGCS